MKIKINDQVKVLSGKDRAKVGKVVQVFPRTAQVVVEGVNIMKKHLRSRKASDKGQVVELAAPLAVGKVMLICPKCGQSARVGYQVSKDSKQRVCHKCHAVIE